MTDKKAPDTLTVLKRSCTLLDKLDPQDRDLVLAWIVKRYGAK